MKTIQLTGGGMDLPRPAAEPGRAGGAAGSRFVRIGAAAGVLFVLLALGGAALARSDALRAAGTLLNATAPLLLILWITSAWRLQLRLSAWRGPAAWRWQAVAYGLWVASFLALMGFVAGSTTAGRSLDALFGTPGACPPKSPWYRSRPQPCCTRSSPCGPASFLPAPRRSGPSARSNQSSTRRPATCW